MTEEQRAEAIVRLYERIAVIANESSGPDAALRAALIAVCEATGWPVGHAFVVSRDRRQLLPTDDWCLQGGDEFDEFAAATESMALPLDGQGPLRQTVRSGRPQWLRDVADEPTYRRGMLVNELPVRGAFMFPILVGHECVAVLEFYAREPAEPDERLLDVMAHVGTQLGRVFERERMFSLERRALEAERMYLSIAAHEIRSPLALATGTLDLLRGDWNELSDTERRRMVDLAFRQSQRLATIVSNFLIEARLRAGAVDPQLTKVEVGAVMRQAAAGVPEITLALRTSDDGPLQVWADEFLLQQCIVNLLTNAVRYGQPPVEVVAERHDSEVQLRVCDAGPGVPREFAPRLFEPFTRGHKRSATGTGIGLSIVSMLVELQGGSVGYYPNDPAGACFEIRMPAVT